MRALHSGFALLLLFALAGCGGAREQYYRLSAMQPAATGLSASGLSVGIGPVTLPGYINRAEVVFATGPNEFQVPANAVWVGSLEENIARTMAANLGQFLRSANVRVGGASGPAPRYRVALEVRQFHGTSGQDAVLDLSWRILDAKGALLRRQSSTWREPIKGDGYAPLVAAESRLLERAARAIAASLRGG